MQNNTQDLVETTVKFIGDSTLITQTIFLLAYIRHAIQNNLSTNINVKIGNIISNSNYLFDVNGMEIPDINTQKEIEIN